MADQHIPEGVVVTNGVIRVTWDSFFGWVLLQRESPEAEEEAYTFDELDAATFALVCSNAQDPLFPDALRGQLAAEQERKQLQQSHQSQAPTRYRDPSWFHTHSSDALH